MDRRQFIQGLSSVSVAAGAASYTGNGLVLAATAMNASEASNAKPILLPMPASIGGLLHPVADLTGTWLFAPDPPDDFWKQDLDLSRWSKIVVPNEFAMLGFAISPDVEYPCRRTIQIPAEFAGHRIFVRFDGVYSYARVWVNGVFVRDHGGGFTSWDAEITSHVQPGSKAELVVGITDQADNISQGSYYAKHSIAGILRSVRMFAAPKAHLSDLAVVASFNNRQTGVISLRTSVSSVETPALKLRFALRDSSGQMAPFEPSSEQEIFSGKPLVQELRVHSPMPWDSEHPHLYSFEIALLENETVIETVERRIGFRSVARDGNQLLVNGQPVKLLGACRHSIHPIYGRAVPPDFDEKDVVLFREANINFVRTSHYPPTETFLEACDRYGIYVEEETPVCWSRSSSSNAGLQEQFLGQFREMIARDGHHACVLFWSLGNESDWGANIAAEKQYAERNDSSRPTIFSYPESAPMGTNPYSIYSKHYANVNSNLDSATYPLLNDEFGHVPCYNLDTLRRDPGVRNFWGESIQRFAEGFLASDGCLGGSIWAGIDEVFLLPKGAVGWGEWGIIDGWRRRKPEHWLTKKAYSPIRINETAPLPIPAADEVLSIPIRNGFNHTNLREVDVQWRAGSVSGKITVEDIGPHDSGFLQIAPRPWQPGEKLQIEFRSRGSLIEQIELQVGSAPRRTRTSAAAKVSLADRVNEYLITGKNFTVVVSKQTGLISQASWGQELVLQGGPFLDIGSGALTSWHLTKSVTREMDDHVIILTSGESKTVEGLAGIFLQFEIEIDGGGLIVTRYRLESKSSELGSLGVAYLLPDTFDKLAWKRKALWSCYPEDHIGRPEGVAPRRPAHALPAYHEQPSWPWSQDISDPFLWSKSEFDAGATNDFRSMKENILWASLSSQQGKARIRIEADADAAVRASVTSEAVCFSTYNYWSYPDLVWGNYTGPATPPAMSTLETKMWLTDQPDESS